MSLQTISLSENFRKSKGILKDYEQHFEKCCFLPLSTAEEVEVLFRDVLFPAEAKTAQIEIQKVESGIKKADRFFDPNQAEDDFI